MNFDFQTYGILFKYTLASVILGFEIRTFSEYLK